MTKSRIRPGLSLSFPGNLDLRFVQLQHRYDVGELWLAVQHHNEQKWLVLSCPEEVPLDTELLSRNCNRKVVSNFSCSAA